MKLPIVFLAVLGLVCGKPLPTGSFQDDLKEFMELVPTEKILEITLDYLAYDPQVMKFVVYIQSEEFPKVHTIVENLEEYKECFKFFNDEGVDVYAIINEIHDKLGYPPFQPTNTTRQGVGFYGLVKDVVAALPLEDLTALLDKKMETGELFKTLVTALKSPVLKKMVNTVRSWPEYQEVREILREMVPNVKPTTKLLWEIYLRETRTLREDLHDLMELFPTNKVFNIVLEYLKNDKEMQEFFVHIQSEEFPYIHRVVEYLKEYKDCSTFINDQGVDVYALILEIHHILGLPPFQPTNPTLMGVGIRGLVADVISVLPLNELKALIDKKTETREYFKVVVTSIRIHIPVVVKMVETVRTWPEYKKLIEILREKRVDVDHVVELLRTLYELSWRGTRRLQEELKEFMPLVPTDKVLEIVLDYLANDEEVREFFVHIQSEEIPKLIQTALDYLAKYPELHQIYVYIQTKVLPKIHKIVEQLKEYKYCFKFINDQGVDVYAIINELHDILEKHPYQPTTTRRNGVGFYGLIKDVVAALPVDDLTALLDKKMVTKDYLKTLVTILKSPVFMKMVKNFPQNIVNTYPQKIVNTVRAWPEYNELLEILQVTVVDVKRITKLLWELSLRETQIIQDDLKEFMALFPTEKVIQLTLDYLANDPELHEIFAYIQSEKYPYIHRVVEYLKKYKDCFKFINDEGVDVYALILEIHHILGLPPLPPTNTTHMGVGIYGYIDDVFAVLPRDELKAFYEKKMETRQYFKTIVTTIKTIVKTLRSPLFVNIANTVRSLPEYQKLLETLRQTGIDVEGIIEHLRAQLAPYLHS